MEWLREKDRQRWAKYEATPEMSYQERKQRIRAAANEPSKLQEFGDNAGKLGSTLTRRLTIPILLFFAGLLFFPFGIILWIVAIGMMFG